MNAKNEDGWTPLHWATHKGHREITELLLAKGADVNAKDESGMTPLHYAADYGHEEIVELLISKGADVNAKDNDGKTPLDLVIQTNKKEIADLLRKHDGRSGSIHGAARGGDIEAVRGFLGFWCGYECEG